MMRTTWTIASVLSLVFACGSIGAQPKEIVPPKELTKPIVGMGTTQAKAKDDALKQAVEVVQVLMEQSNPPMTSFKADAEYVKRLLANDGAAGEDKQIDLPNEKGIVAKTWKISFRSEAWRDIVHRDREAQRKLVSEQRQTWAARAVLGLAVLLMAGYGYVRLDEYTQRRYTTWLRIAGVGVAVSVLAGWLWVFQAS